MVSLFKVKKDSINLRYLRKVQLHTIGDKIVETLYSNRVTSENPSPVPSIQSWDVSCFLKVARTVAQHCMEGMGEETLSFPLLKSGKRQKVHLGRSVSTHFVADCSCVTIIHSYMWKWEPWYLQCTITILTINLFSLF